MPALAMNDGEGPHASLIEAAWRAGRLSPCAKSKRGVAVIWRGQVIASAFNGKPWSGVSAMAFGGSLITPCDGSDACRVNCNKLCVHAEMRAMRVALRMAQKMEIESEDLTLLHVKVVNDKVVAGGPPSCWQCSREILDAGIGHVWLYEAAHNRSGNPDCDCTVCAYAKRHPQLGAERCWERPSWVFYSAMAFHQATIRTCRDQGELA